MRSLSVELKLAVVILFVSVAAALVAARLSGEVYERAVAATAIEKLRRATELLRVHERTEVERLGSMLDVLSVHEGMTAAFLARDREALLALAGPQLQAMRERDRVTGWYFVEPDGTVFLRVHRPELSGDRPGRHILQRAINTGQPFSGLELGRTSFALRVVRPWRAGGKVVGYLELAEEVSQFLGAMKARTGDDYGLVLSKKYVDREAWQQGAGARLDTWNDRAEALVVGATSFGDGIVDFEGDVTAVPLEGLLLGEVSRGGHTLVRGVFPVQDVTERNVGGLFVLRDDTGDRQAIRGGHLRASLVAMGVALTAALVTFLALRRLVFARLRRLRRELEARAAEAGLPGSRIIDLRSEDELGRLELLLDRLFFPQGRGDAGGRPGDREAR